MPNDTRNFTIIYNNRYGDGEMTEDPNVLLDRYNNDLSPIGQIQVCGNSITIQKQLVDVMSRYNDGWDYHYLNSDNLALDTWLHSKPNYNSFQDWINSAKKL